MKASRVMILVTAWTVLAAANAVAGPLKVYIMTGQSNMQGKARPSTAPYQVQPHVVEYMKSHNVYEKLERSLADKREKSGVYYNKVIEHVKDVLADPGKYCSAYDPQAGYELAGFVWFQGWNDMIDGHTYQQQGPDAYEEYTRLLAHFIRDVRKDLEAPNMPFVIGVLGVGGVTDGPFQNAQAAPADMPEFQDNVVAVRTGEYWDRELGELDQRMVDKVLKPLGRQSRGLSRDEARELKEKLIKENFTDEELKLLETGTSNASFHYLGSAKVYSRIGRAFAGALLDLKTTD